MDITITMTPEQAEAAKEACVCHNCRAMPWTNRCKGEEQCLRKQVHDLIGAAQEERRKHRQGRP